MTPAYKRMFSDEQRCISAPVVGVSLDLLPVRQS